MVVSLAKNFHSKLLDIFKENPRIVGRIYSMGIVLFIVCQRFAVKIANGKSNQSRPC